MGRRAAGADRVGFGEGMSPSPIGVGIGEGAVPPPHKIFLTFWLEIVHVGVYSDKSSQFRIE